MSLVKNFEMDDPIIMDLSPESVPPYELRCCGRLRVECNPCQPWFQLIDSNGRMIDLQASFCPNSYKSLLFKVVTSGFVLAFLLFTWIDGGNAGFFLAFLTNWGQLCSTFYFLFSFTNSLLYFDQPSVTTLTWTMKAAWVLFGLASHLEVVVTLLFWTLDYQPSYGPPSFQACAAHGMLVTFVLTDGLYVSRIPVRWQHYYGSVLPLNIAYVIWTIVHDELQLGNPESKKSDLLYPVVDWRHHPASTAIIMALVVLVVSPLVYLLIWSASAYTWGSCCQKSRRYYVELEQSKNSQSTDPEDLDSSEQ